MKRYRAVIIFCACVSLSAILGACGEGVSTTPVEDSQDDSDTIVDGDTGGSDKSDDNLVCEGDYSIAGADFTKVSGCTVITGNLEIKQNKSLVNLAALESLTSVGKTLNISSNKSLTSLEGLENLTSTGGLVIQGNGALGSLASLGGMTTTGEVNIQVNNILTDLKGLENISYLEGDLIIYENESLTNLAGLENITAVEGDLTLGIVSELGSLAGLKGLTSVGGYLYILGGVSLTSLAGLENLGSAGSMNISNTGITNVKALNNLSSVAGLLYLGQNKFLGNLAGFENITSVGDLHIYANGLSSLTGLDNLGSVNGYLTIRYNDITNLTGLENLGYVGGDLFFENIDNLTSLAGLEKLAVVGGAFTVKNNITLPECRVTELAGAIDIAGSVNISGNNGVGTCNPVLFSLTTGLDGFGGSSLGGSGVQAGECDIITPEGNVHSPSSILSRGDWLSPAAGTFVGPPGGDAARGASAGVYQYNCNFYATDPGTYNFIGEIAGDNAIEYIGYFETEANLVDLAVLEQANFSRATAIESDLFTIKQTGWTRIELRVRNDTASPTALWFDLDFHKYD